MAETPEGKICKALVEGYRRRYPIESANLIHIPNGGKMTKWQRIRLHLLGECPGAADYLLALPRGGYPGLFLEVKTPTGQTSSDQRLFLSRMDKAGYFTAVGYGLQESREILVRYTRGETAALAWRIGNYRKSELNKARKASQLKADWQP